VTIDLGAAAAHPTDYAGQLRRYWRVGALLALLFVGGLVLWSTTAPLSSAVVAVGRLEVEGSIKKVQHETGGTITEIRVAEGSRVTAGDLLIQLDATTARANLDIIEGKFDEQALAVARLQAERDNLPSFALPAELVDRADDPLVMSQLASEQRLFSVRRAAREGQKDQLTARIGQYQSQIDGLRQEADGKARELELTTTELANARDLAARGVTSQARVNELDRAEAQLKADAGQIAAQIAELGGRIAETRLEILNVDRVAIADAGRDLGEAQSALGEMMQRRLAAAEQLTRTQIRAPITGVVHQLQVHTVGGVAAPGEVLLTVVPSGGPLDIEARLSPADIQAVRVGDSATIRFPGLNHTNTPELTAKVTVVGADLTEDLTTRMAYYPVTLDLSAEEAGKLGGIELVPGMPVEAFIANGQRTLFDYLIEPIRDRMAHAMRER
jgi:HlyD family secretion protein